MARRKQRVQEVKVQGEHITLGQLLKVAGVIDTGGQARAYLAELPVLVNDEPESRRGRKLFPGDRIRIETIQILLV